METIHSDETPLASYLEGNGYLDAHVNESDLKEPASEQGPGVSTTGQSYAPPNRIQVAARSLLAPLQTTPQVQSSIGRIHNACSSAVNSRVGRADNARFIEHFRYIIVASQLLNEYLDHGSIPPGLIANYGLDGTGESPMAGVTVSISGATITAAVAFMLVYLMHWARNSQGAFVSKGRLALALTILAIVAFVGYAYIRRQWLKFLRRNAVTAASRLTASWQVFELSTSSALSFIQEVELVSKGYRLTTPLPPASRIEENGPARRCARLRKALHRAYGSLIPTVIQACETLSALIDADDLEKYFEVYDISAQDAQEASGADALSVLEDDPESLKSLRVLSYRAGVLRRVLLCSLMSLEADGGKPDFSRWRSATEMMEGIHSVISTSAERLRQQLSEMETITIPQTPARSGHTPTREKMRSQVRKISALSSGIKGLQAKMQVLREETNRSIENSEDMTDLGPSLMAQYESIGSDLKDLMRAWETGKASLQSNITKQEHRISLASSGLRSPVSSLGGLTAVEEGGSPADALKALNGDSLSNRSSMATSPSDEEQIFEAIAVPKRRSTMTREERILKMQEERDRQATLRAKRESNTNMLRELESVINLRPKKTSAARITSM